MWKPHCVAICEILLVKYGCYDRKCNDEAITKVIEQVEFI